MIKSSRNKNHSYVDRIVALGLSKVKKYLLKNNKSGAKNSPAENRWAFRS
jgi:hypothetical protein